MRALWCVDLLVLILLCNGGEVSVNLRLGEDVELGAVLGHHGHLQPIKKIPSQSIIQRQVKRQQRPTLELESRVADPHHLDADPDLAFHFDADPNPDPTTHFYQILTLQCSTMTF
jgi:hypothetical protein